MPKNEFCCDCTVVHNEVVAKVAEKMYDNTEFDKATNLYKIFADNTRVKILWALNLHEMCVCDIANLLSMTKSAISHQLNVLRTSGLAKFRKEGKTVYYSLADNHVKDILEIAFEHIDE